MNTGERLGWFVVITVHVQSGLTVAATGPETFILCVKAVGVTAATTVPEGRACTDVFVKEPRLDIVGTLDTSVSLQLTLG